MNARKVSLERFYSNETFPIYTATNMNGYKFTEEVQCRIYPELSLLFFSDCLSWTQTTPMPRSDKSKDSKTQCIIPCLIVHYKQKVRIVCLTCRNRLFFFPLEDNCSKAMIMKTSGRGRTVRTWYMTKPG